MKKDKKDKFEGTLVQKLGGGQYIVPAKAMYVVVNGQRQHATPVVMVDDWLNGHPVMVWLVKNPYGSHNLAITGGDAEPFVLGNVAVARHLDNLGYLDDVVEFLNTNLAERIYRLLEEADEFDDAWHRTDLDGLEILRYKWSKGWRA